MKTDLTNAAIALYVVETGLALVFLLLRGWSHFLFGGLSWDDLCMVLSWVSFAATTAQAILLAENGAFRNYPEPTPEQQLIVLKVNYVARPFAIFSVLVVKIAVGYLILRILSGSASRGIKIFVWTVLGINSLIGVLDSIFTFTQCDPPEALWTPALMDTATCWDPVTKANFGVASSALNAATDFVLSVLPAAIIWKLKLDLKKRLGLIALLGVGILSVISAIVKTYQLAQPLEMGPELARQAFDLYAWTSAEIFILHFCASIPTYKPLWLRYVSNKKKTEFSSQGYKLPTFDQSQSSNQWTIQSRAAAARMSSAPIASGSHDDGHDDSDNDGTGIMGMSEPRDKNGIFISRSVTINSEYV